MNMGGPGQMLVNLRQELAAMWLPWCVARVNRTEIIKIDAEPERCHQAMQLRVGDLADDDVRRALTRQVVRNDGRNSIDLIVDRGRGFRALSAARERVTIVPAGTVDDPTVFLTAEGPMLHEGCHRLCGLYDAGIEWFELTLRVDPLFGPWLIYGTGLRQRHPVFLASFRLGTLGGFSA